MEVEVRGQESEVRSQSLDAMQVVQQTLKREFVRSGIGLHTGATVQVRVLPALPGEGRYFVRVDLPDAPVISARVELVNQTTLSTELALGGTHVRTVEHLLAALAGMGVDNARVEIDGPEAPLLDGSAQEWVTAIAEVGTISLNEPRPIWSVQEPVWVYEGDAFVAALPAPETRFTYGIDFALPAIGNQWHSWTLGAAEQQPSTFAQEIAPARTFGLAHQIDYLRANGLIKGGSLDNALVCGPEGWLNPPLRFANEPARHKLLDLVGDLSLLGGFPIAHILAYKASHKLHIQLARAIARSAAGC